jgi:hypothetical protein
MVRRRGPRSFPPPSIVGIDDWAWRRNHRYGTLVCDLERHATIALLPDREPATAEAWLAQQSQICVVARDRGGGYAGAAQRALPHAIQVADRWHLMENASSAFLDAVRKSMRQIRTAMGSTVVDPLLLTFAEKLQYEGYVRREETNAVILSLSEQGIAIKEIVRRTGYSRGLIRKILRGQRSDVFRVRQSSLEPYLPWLDEQWEAGCRNGAALWRALRLRGFRGCLRVVSEWSARRKKSERADPAALARAPSARTVARLLTVGRERLSKSETITVAAIESGVAVLVEGERDHSGIPGHHSPESACRVGHLDQQGPHQPRRRVRQRRVQRQSSDRGGDRAVVVHRAGRGTDLQAEARQAPDVRPRKHRPSSGTCHRPPITAPSSKVHQSQFCTPIDADELLRNLVRRPVLQIGPGGQANIIALRGSAEQHQLSVAELGSRLVRMWVVVLRVHVVPLCCLHAAGPPGLSLRQAPDQSDLRAKGLRAAHKPAAIRIHALLRMKSQSFLCQGAYSAYKCCVLLKRSFKRSWLLLDTGRHSCRPDQTAALLRFERWHSSVRERKCAFWGTIGHC